MPTRDEYRAERGLFRPSSPAVRAAVLEGFEPTSTLDVSSWAEAWGEICDERLAAVALRVAEAEHATAPEAILAELRAASFAQAAYSVEVLHQTGPLLDALEAAQIDHVISKGIGIALCSDSIQERPFVDVDVIVRPADQRAALDICRSLGYAEAASSQLTWDWLGRHTREAINLTDGSGGSVDVHRAIPPWYWGNGLSFDLLTAETHVLTFGGRRYRCLSPEANLLVVALHVVSDKNRPGATLMVWRDLLTLMRACDPARLRTLADRSETTAWLRWILAQLPAHVLRSEVVQALEGGADRISGGRRLSLLLPPRIGSRFLLSQPLRLPPLRGAAYLAGAVVPSPAFLRRYYGDEAQRASHYLSWWRHLVSTFRTAVNVSDEELGRR